MRCFNGRQRSIIQMKDKCKDKGITADQATAEDAASINEGGSTKACCCCDGECHIEWAPDD